VEHIGLHDVEQCDELIGDDRRTIRVRERAGDRVVDELDDRQSVLHAPRDVSVRSQRIVVGRQHGDVVPASQFADSSNAEISEPARCRGRKSWIA
jgi:hypothetical protein